MCTSNGKGIDLTSSASIIRTLSPEEADALSPTLEALSRTCLLSKESAEKFKNLPVDKRLETSRLVVTLMSFPRVHEVNTSVDVLLRLLHQSSSVLSACPAKPYVDLLTCIVFVLRSSKSRKIEIRRCSGNVLPFFIRCLKHAGSEEVLFLSLLGVDAVLPFCGDTLDQIGTTVLSLMRAPTLLMKDQTNRHSLRTFTMAVYLMDSIFEFPVMQTTSTYCDEIHRRGLDLHCLCKMLESTLQILITASVREKRQSFQLNHNEEENRILALQIALRGLSLVNRLLNLTGFLDLSNDPNEDILPLNHFFVRLADLLWFARRAADDIESAMPGAYSTLEVLVLSSIRSVILAQPCRAPDFARQDGRLRQVVSLSQCLSSSGREVTCLVLLAATGQVVVEHGLIGLEEVLVHLESTKSGSIELELLAEVAAMLLRYQETVTLSSLNLIACVIEQSVSLSDRIISLLCRAMCSGLKLRQTMAAPEAEEQSTDDVSEDADEVELKLYERSIACLIKVLACFRVDAKEELDTATVTRSLHMLHALKSLCLMLTLPDAAARFVSTGGVVFLLGLAKVTWEKLPEICIKALVVLRCIASNDSCAHSMAKPEFLESLFAFATGVDVSGTETETTNDSRSTTLHPRISRLAASVLMALPFPFELSETCYIALVKTFLFLPTHAVSGHIFGAKIFSKINFSPIGYKILRQQRCIARLIKFACDPADSGSIQEVSGLKERENEDVAWETCQYDDVNLRRSYALLALAYCAKDKINQVYLAQKALDKLLIVVWTSDAKYDHELIGLILAQVNSHKANRTRIYKAEMKARELCHFHEKTRSSSRATTPQRSTNQLPKDSSVASKEEFQKAVLQHAKPFLDVSANPSLAVKSNRMENANKHSLVHKLRLSTKMMWKRLESATDRMHNHAPSWDQPVYKDRIFEGSKGIPRPRCYADMEPEELVLEVQNGHNQEEIHGSEEGWKKAIQGIKGLNCTMLWDKQHCNGSLVNTRLNGALELEPVVIPKEPMLIVFRERAEENVEEASKV